MFTPIRSNFFLQIVGVAREDEGRYDAFADNGLGVCPKYPSTSPEMADYMTNFNVEDLSNRHQ